MFQPFDIDIPYSEHEDEDTTFLTVNILNFWITLLNMLRLTAGCCKIFQASTNYQGE